MLCEHYTNLTILSETTAQSLVLTPNIWQD